jgi:hypothetical protein
MGGGHPRAAWAGVSYPRLVPSPVALPRDLPLLLQIVPRPLVHPAAVARPRRLAESVAGPELLRPPLLLLLPPRPPGVVQWWAVVDAVGALDRQPAGAPGAAAAAAAQGAGGRPVIWSAVCRADGRRGARPRPAVGWARRVGVAVGLRLLLLALPTSAVRRVSWLEGGHRESMSDNGGEFISRGGRSVAFFALMVLNLCALTPFQQNQGRCCYSTLFAVRKESTKSWIGN